MKHYVKPTLEIESFMVGVAVAATYADPNDYPYESDGNEAELSAGFWGDLFDTTVQ